MDLTWPLGSYGQAPPVKTNLVDASDDAHGATAGGIIRSAWNLIRGIGEPCEDELEDANFSTAGEAATVAEAAYAHSASRVASHSSDTDVDVVRRTWALFQQAMDEGWVDRWVMQYTTEDVQLEDHVGRRNPALCKGRGEMVAYYNKVLERVWGGGQLTWRPVSFYGVGLGSGVVIAQFDVEVVPRGRSHTRQLWVYHVVGPERRLRMVRSYPLAERLDQPQVPLAVPSPQREHKREPHVHPNGGSLRGTVDEGMQQCAPLPPLRQPPPQQPLPPPQAQRPPQQGLPPPQTQPPPPQPPPQPPPRYQQALYADGGFATPPSHPQFVDAGEPGLRPAFRELRHAAVERSSSAPPILQAPRSPSPAQNGGHHVPDPAPTWRAHPQPSELPVAANIGPVASDQRLQPAIQLGSAPTPLPGMAVLPPPMATVPPDLRVGVVPVVPGPSVAPPTFAKPYGQGRVRIGEGAGDGNSPPPASPPPLLQPPEAMPASGKDRPTDPARAKRATEKEQPPPCNHNMWDNVRIKRGWSILRCRACALQWRLRPTSIPHCPEFARGAGECPAGATCQMVHVFRMRESAGLRSGTAPDCDASTAAGEAESQMGEDNDT